MPQISERRRSAARPLLLLAVLLLGAPVLTAAGSPSSAAPAPTPAVQQSGLVAAYSFDERGGMTVADSSGNGNDGTINGAAWTTGRSGSALAFDGVDDLVTIPRSGSLDARTMTVEAWVRPTRLGPLDVLAGSRLNLPLARWTHVAVTQDGTSVRIFANASQIASKVAASKVARMQLPLRIAGDSTWGEWFAGAVDDVRVYNRALSRAQINRDMLTPAGSATADLPAVGPEPPRNLAVVSRTGTSLAIRWQASPSLTTAGYGLYRDGTRVDTTPGTSSTFGGLACGTSYRLGVDAYDLLGFRSTQETVDAQTAPCPDTQAPAAPTSLRVDTTTRNSISVSWAPSSDNVGVTGYGVYRDGSLTGSTPATSFTFTALPCGTTFALSVDAVDAAGNRSARSTASGSTAPCAPPADTQPPTAPGALAVTGATASSVSVSWNASSDNVGVAGYTVYRDGSAAGSTQTTGHTFGSLSCGSTYTLAVDAFDAAGNRSSKASVVGRTSACPPPADTQPPTTPGDFSVTSVATTSVSVRWTASTDNSGVASYGLYRDGAAVGSTGSTSYTFEGLGCGTSYTLSVDAADAAGNRSSRSSQSVSTASCPDTQPPTAPTNVAVTGSAATSISISWTASLDNTGVAGYGLYRGATSAGTAQATSFTFSGLQCGTTYQLGVDAYDAAGNRSATTSTSGSTAACADTAPPSTPTSLVVGAVSSSSVALSWAASSDNVGVAGYGRYRDSALVSSGSGTSYTFTGLTCNTGYAFAIDAYDAAGNRSGKAQTTATTSACTPPPPPPPTPGSANLWLDVNGGSCTRQASPGGYNDAQACGSMQAAANAAVSGDTINIVDGSYGGQSLSGTKTLTFRAAGPGRPSFGQLVVAASNQTFRRLLVENRAAQPTPFCNTWILDYTLFVCGPSNTFDDVMVDGLRKGSGNPDRRGGLQVTGSATNLVFKNGEIRGVWDSKGFQGGANDMLIENTLWQDIRLTPAGESAGVHNECAYISSGNNQTWRGNRFILCPVMAMFFANYNGGPPFSNVLVENNLFTHATNSGGGWHDGASFVIPNGASGQNQVNNWIVRYNTFEVPPNISSTPSTADNNGSAQFYGNLGATGDCGIPEWTYSYNVGRTCGGIGERSVPNATNTRTSPNQSPFYVNAPANDFHLKPGTNTATNVGAPAYPTTDLEGNTRPWGASADAGAYERQS